MNRENRRKKQKREREWAKKRVSSKPRLIEPSFSAAQTTAARMMADFSAVPLATICKSIQLLIQELQARGYPLYDFDDKERSIKEIMIMRDKVFFLADKEEHDE